VEAGFANVQLGHTYQVWSGREPETQLGAVFLQRHPSYADAARQVLGDGAEAHLAPAARDSHPPPQRRYERFGIHYGNSLIWLPGQNLGLELKLGQHRENPRSAEALPARVGTTSWHGAYEL